MNKSRSKYQFLYLLSFPIAISLSLLGGCGGETTHRQKIGHRNGGDANSNGTRLVKVQTKECTPNSNSEKKESILDILSLIQSVQKKNNLNVRVYTSDFRLLEEKSINPEKVPKAEPNMKLQLAFLKKYRDSLLIKYASGMADSFLKLNGPSQDISGGESEPLPNADPENLGIGEMSQSPFIPVEITDCDSIKFLAPNHEGLLEPIHFKILKDGRSANTLYLENQNLKTGTEFDNYSKLFIQSINNGNALQIDGYFPAENFVCGTQTEQRIGKISYVVEWYGKANIPDAFVSKHLKNLLIGTKIQMPEGFHNGESTIAGKLHPEVFTNALNEFYTQDFDSNDCKPVSEE